MERNDDSNNKSQSPDDLSWRLDPSESFSDYTIEIVPTPKRKISPGKSGNLVERTAYHVHKAILAVGNRKSNYFSAIFRGGSFRETQLNMSRIELNEMAAAAFPALLDYIYRASKPFSAKHAVPLLYLSKYFQVDSLSESVKYFILSKIMNHPAKTVTFYVHAKIFQQADVVEMLVEKFSELKYRRYILSQKIFFKEIDPTFWISVLDRIPEEDRTASSVSRTICMICTSWPELDKELFLQLTDKKYLRIVDSVETACELMKLERGFCGVDKGKISDLQDRCIQAFAESWLETDTSSEYYECLKELGGENPVLLLEVLVRSVSAAQTHALH